MNLHITQQDVNDLVLGVLRQTPKQVVRMKTGMSNEVYRVSLTDGTEVFIRINENEKDLLGSNMNIPVFQHLGILVPEILKQDFSKIKFPFCYQILSKIEGTDLRGVFFDLTEDQIATLAKDVFRIVSKLQVEPLGQGFGETFIGEQAPFSSWFEYIANRVKIAKERNAKTHVLTDEAIKIVDSVLEKLKPDLLVVKPKLYFDDMCSNNLMIADGAFSGLVDLDGVTYGDFRDLMGSIKASWMGTDQGAKYMRALEKEFKFTEQDQKIILGYTIICLVYWTSEQGMQFNQNTSTVIDHDLVRLRHEEIRSLYQEFQSKL